MSSTLPLLVDGAWLEARIDDPGLRVIDASWYLPSENRDARAEYREAHIPGAIYLDLSVDLADPDAPVRNTLAAPDALATATETELVRVPGIGPLLAQELAGRHEPEQTTL